MEPREFDVVIIGAGPAGETAAVHAARTGARVALIERELVGGECPYWGCMPAKALLRPAQALAEALRMPGAASRIVDGAPAPAEVLAFRSRVNRGGSDHAHAEQTMARGVTLLRGRGRVTGERRVAFTPTDGADPVTLAARHAVMIATGTRAAIPPVPGLAAGTPWTNREATTAEHVPDRLIMLGGGVIAVELAQAWCSLGAKVTIVERAERLLAREEPEASALVTESLAAAGIDIRCDREVVRAERRPAGGWVLDVAGDEPISGDELLVATGRRANSDDIGLDALGVACDERSGAIPTAPCMSVPGFDWLYAIGDVNGRAQFTHTAAYQAKVAVATATGTHTECVDDHAAAPRVTFTDPVVAAVGHTLESARAAGLRVRSVDRDPQHTAGAAFFGRGTDGFARLVVDEQRRTIVGATFVGPDLGELLHSATIAIVGEVSLDTLRHCIPAFPTRSEVWTRLVDRALAQQP